jgi:hypothetical protein
MSSLVQSHHKSSLSLYEKIRKMSVFDPHHRPEGKYRWEHLIYMEGVLKHSKRFDSADVLFLMPNFLVNVRKIKLLKAHKVHSEIQIGRKNFTWK